MFLMPPFLVVYLDGGGQLVGGVPRDFVLDFLFSLYPFEVPAEARSFAQCRRREEGERESLVGRMVGLICRTRSWLVE